MGLWGRGHERRIRLPALHRPRAESARHAAQRHIAHTCAVAHRRRCLLHLLRRCVGPAGREHASP